MANGGELSLGDLDGNGIRILQVQACKGNALIIVAALNLQLEFEVCSGFVLGRFHLRFRNISGVPSGWHRFESIRRINPGCVKIKFSH
jgi:hypothetical protein